MSGLQCWDGSGTLIVDLGDYNMRYMGSTSINIGTGVNSWSVGWSGMRTTGWLAIFNSQQYYNEFSCICNNDSFTVQYLPTGGTYARTLTFDIYTFNNG